MSSPVPVPLPDLFPGIPLREVTLPFSTQSVSLLLLKDPLDLIRDKPEEPDDAAEPLEVSGNTGEVYWGDLWPAALALGEALLDGEVWLPSGNAPILEIGCGSGLVSVCAALAGKGEAQLVASDHEARALELAAANAGRNGVGKLVTTKQLDWRERYPEKHRLILAADVLYHPDAAWNICAFLREALDDDPRSEARAVVVDPERWSARHFSLLARENGLRVREFRRVVPFTGAQSSVRIAPLSGPLTDGAVPEGKPVEAVFYELRLKDAP